MKIFKGFLVVFTLVLFCVAIAHSKFNDVKFIKLFEESSFVAIASIVTILSFFLSVWLVLIAKDVKKSVLLSKQKKTFIQKREVNAVKLTADRDTMSMNGVLDQMLINSISLEVRKFSNFTELHNRKDRRTVKEVFKNLEQGVDGIDRRLLNEQLTYIISQYEEEKVEFLNV